MYSRPKRRGRVKSNCRSWSSRPSRGEPGDWPRFYALLEQAPTKRERRKLKEFFDGG